MPSRHGHHPRHSERRLAACGAEGTSVIYNAAREPEIVDLQALLRSMGARVNGAGGSIITVEGGTALHGCTHRVIGDRIVCTKDYSKQVEYSAENMEMALEALHKDPIFSAEHLKRLFG